MMKFAKTLQLFCLLIPVLILGACERSNQTPGSEMAVPAAVVNPVQEDERLAIFFDEIFERDVKASPMFQAYQGRKTADYGSWDDFSDEYAQFENQQAAKDLERLRTEFDYELLSDSAKMSYQIFEYNQERDLRNFEWRFHNYAISPMDDIASDLPTFLQNIHKIETRQDAIDYISRLKGIPEVKPIIATVFKTGLP